VIAYFRRRLSGVSNQRLAMTVANTIVALLFLIWTWHDGAYGWSMLFATISAVGVTTVIAMVRLR
jgi:hypothetical protein